MSLGAINLNPLQSQMVASLIRGDRFISVRAGWGSGKTSGLVFSIIYCSILYPGEPMLLVTDTSARFERVLLPEMIKWMGALGWSYIAGRNVTGRWVEPTTGTTVWVVSYIRASTKASQNNPMEGINAARAFIDECQTLQPEVAVKAFGRIRAGTHPTLMMTGLPVAGAWWMQYAEERHGATVYAISHVNAANLGDGWLAEAENLPAAERDAMIYNRPQPPDGQVYREWVAQSYPAGNLAPTGWAYSPEMECRIAGDWGLNKPWVGIIAHDEALGVDVLVAELNPKEVTVGELVRLILLIAWPRDRADQMPRDGRHRFLLDAGSGDKAGRARNDQTLRSTFDVLGLPPPSKRVPKGDESGTDAVGIGVHLRSTTSPVRCDIKNGVLRVKSRIIERGLLCAQDVWADGLSGQHGKAMSALGVKHNRNSFAASLMNYRYPDNGSEDPVKDGREDPMDGIRYDTINWRYHGTERPRLPPKVEDAPTRAVAVAAGPRRSWKSRGVGR